MLVTLGTSRVKQGQGLKASAADASLAKFAISAIPLEVTHARTRQFVSKRLGASPRALGWTPFPFVSVFSIRAEAL